MAKKESHRVYTFTYYTTYPYNRLEKFSSIREGNGDIRIHFSFTQGDPGQYTGPPEFCYPAEADEIEVLRIEYVICGVWRVLNKKVFESVEEWILKEKFDELCTYAWEEKANEWEYMALEDEMFEQ